MRLVGLTPVEMKAVTMREIFLDPVSVTLGEQVLVNENFLNMTVGAEVVLDPGFDSAVAWTYSVGWNVASSEATHTGGTSDNLQTAANVTNIGDSYVAEVTTTTLTENGSQRITSRWADNNYTCSLGVTTVYTAAVGSPTPQTPALRSAGSTGGQWITPNFSVKPISLDSYVEVGTRSATEYMVFDDLNKTVRIVSGGALIGISQVIPDFAAGDYFYRIFIPVANSGSLILNTVGDGTLATLNSIGLHEGVVSITDSDLRLGFGAAGDATLGSFKLYPVIGE